MINDKIDTILHDYAVEESLRETNLADKLKRKVITADEYDERLVEGYRANKEQAKQALLTLIEEIVNDVIGEDEYTLSLVALLDVAITTEDLDRERAKQAQNQLREQQRANFKKVMGK